MNLSPFESLPAELLEKIFSYVPPVEIPFEKPWICKRWSDVVQSPEHWRRRAETLNLKISRDEWKVLQIHDNKKASEKCMWRVCTLNYMKKFTKNYHPPPLRWVITDERFKRKGEEIQKSQLELMMNTACAQILLRSIVALEMFSTSSLFGVESFPLLLKLVAITNYKPPPFKVHPRHCDISQQELMWTLLDDFSWWKFKPTFTNLFDSNEVLFRPLDISRFKGCLHSIDNLSQEDIHTLSLAIAVDENNVAIDPGLAKLNKFLKLQRFYLHIKAGTDVHTLGQCKVDLKELCLHFSSVDPSHIEWVINSTKILQPRRKVFNDVLNDRQPRPGFWIKPYNYLVFFDCLLNNQQMDELLRGLASAGVMVDKVLATGPKLEDDGSDDLAMLVYQLSSNDVESSEKKYKRFDSIGDLVFHMEHCYSGVWSGACSGGRFYGDNIPRHLRQDGQCFPCSTSYPSSAAK